MSNSKVYMLIMLKKLTNQVECLPELIHFLRHRVDGDDRVILMLPHGLTTEGNHFHGLGDSIRGRPGDRRRGKAEG